MGFPLVSRCFGIIVSICVPFLALILPFGHLQKLNALVAGGLAIALSFGALASYRCRLAAAAVGGWLAVSAILFGSTFVDRAVTVTAGIALFFFLVGPFSDRPRLERADMPASHAPIDDPRSGVAHAA